MEMNRKPRLGVLALMLEAYEPLFPGITAQQTAYVQEVLASLQDTADFTFPKIALNRSDIEKLTAAYNAADLDGIEGDLEIGSADRMPLLFQAMEQAGFHEREIEQIAWKNAERVLAVLR